MEPNPKTGDAGVMAEQMECARRLAQRLIADADRAEDVAQEAAVTAWRKPSPPGWAPTAWIAGIVRNVARQQDRAERRRRRRERLVARAESLGADRLVAERVAEHRRLVDAVLRLPEDYRTAVWLRWFEEEPPRRIAQRLGVPVETVRTRCRRGVEVLRREMDRGSEADRERWRLALAPLPAAPWWWSVPWLGGIAVGTKTKTAAVALVLLLAGGAGWFALSEGSGSSDPRPEDALAVESDGAGRPTAALEGAATPAGAPEDGGAPAVRSVAGRVVDVGGDPVADAEVRVGSADVLSPDEHPFAARTASDGTFRVPLDREDAVVSASRPGYRPAQRRVERPEEPLVLRLQRTATRWFRVLDRDTDLPLADVLCEAFFVTDAGEVRLASRGDAGGLVAIDDPGSSTGTVRFWRAGYGPLFLEPEGHRRRGTAEDPFPVYLVPEPAFLVRVVDARGDPVEGAEVEGWVGTGAVLWQGQRVLSTGGFVFGEQRRMALGRRTTDAQGRAALDAITPTEPLVVRARKDGALGFAHARASSRRASSLDVVLRPAVEISGVVVGPDDAPLPGILVRYGLAPAAGVPLDAPPPVLDLASQTRTDAAGRFVLREVPTAAADGTVNVSANDATFGFTWAAVDLSRAEAARDVRLRFPPRDVMRVRVKDDEGRPIVGAWVSYQGMIPRSRTDAVGYAERARVANLPNPLEVVAEGHLPWKGPPPEGDDVLEVVLSRERTLVGRLVDETGAPTTGWVEVFDRSVGSSDDARELPPDDARRLGRATPGIDGRFRVTELPAGPWLVAAARTDFTGGEWKTARAERNVAEGEDARMALPAAPPAPPRVVEGRVVDADGRPVVEFHASLHAPGAQPAVLLGRRFRFEGVAAGSYEVFVTSPDGSRQAVVPVVVPSDRDPAGLVVTLEETLVLLGRLEAEGAADLSGLPVRARTEDGTLDVGWGQTDAAGVFRIPRLRPGAYRLVAEPATTDGRSEAWEVVDPLVKIERSDDAPRSVRVRPAGRLALRLEAEGFAAGWEEARLAQPDVGLRSQLAKVEVAGPEGRAFSGSGLYHGVHAQPWALTPGRWTLRVTTRDRGSFETSFEVRPHERTEVLVDLRR